MNRQWKIVFWILRPILLSLYWINSLKIIQRIEAAEYIFVE